MNKRLFVLICSVILFQYIYNTTCDEDKGADETFSKSLCNQRDGQNSQICVAKYEGEGETRSQVGCELKEKGSVPCEEVESGASDALCKSLQKTDNNHLCVKDGNACTEKQKCKGSTGTSDTDCQKYAVETAGYVCKKVQNENKCTEEKATSSSYSLKFSLALLIFLFLF